MVVFYLYVAELGPKEDFIQSGLKNKFSKKFHFLKEKTVRFFRLIKPTVHGQKMFSFSLFSVQRFSSLRPLIQYVHKKPELSTISVSKGM